MYLIVSHHQVIFFDKNYSKVWILLKYYSHFIFIALLFISIVEIQEINYGHEQRSFNKILSFKCVLFASLRVNNIVQSYLHLTNLQYFGIMTFSMPFQCCSSGHPCLLFVPVSKPWKSSYTYPFWLAEVEDYLLITFRYMIIFLILFCCFWLLLLTSSPNPIWFPVI